MSDVDLFGENVWDTKTVTYFRVLFFLRGSYAVHCGHAHFSSTDAKLEPTEMHEMGLHNNGTQIHDMF